MALLEGKTPEQIAADIVKDAAEEKMILVSGTAFQKLETVVRYLNRDKIAARGQTWFNKNHDTLITDAVETLVTAREKAITDYQNKKDLQAKDEQFRDLTARGVKADEAYKQAYL